MFLEIAFKLEGFGINLFMIKVEGISFIAVFRIGSWQIFLRILVLVELRITFGVMVWKLWKWRNDHCFSPTSLHGTSSGNPGHAVAGNLIRDASGTWLVGSGARHLLFLQAELWGAFCGPSLAWNPCYFQVELEVDSATIAHALNSKDALIQDPIFQVIVEMKTRNWCVHIRHTFHEGIAIKTG